MEDKTLITREKVEHLKKEYGAVFYIEVVLASIAALITLSLCMMPGMAVS